MASPSFNGDTRPVSLRVTESEYHNLRTSARAKGVSLNVYLRTRLGLPGSPMPGSPVSAPTGTYKAPKAAAVGK